MTHADHFAALPEKKTTLVGYQQRIDRRFDKPERLDRVQYEALSELERDLYDDRRVLWFGAGLRLETHHSEQLTKAVRSALRRRDPFAIGELGIVVTGKARVGKTTMLFATSRQVEQVIKQRNPNYRAEGVVPVVYIEVPAKATPKTIAEQIIRFFGVPHSSSSKQDVLVTLATDLLQSHATKMLVVDELQMLQLHGKAGDDAVNTLKTIMNGTSALCVFAGIDLPARLGSHAAEQVLARCDIITVNPFSVSTPGARREWLELLRRFGKEMYLLDVQPDHLLPYADLLMDASGGSVGNLRDILGSAAEAAIFGKSKPSAQETVSQRDLERCVNVAKMQILRAAA